MDGRSIGIAIVTALIVSGCSGSESYVLYSSLDRLPESPAPLADWTPASPLPSSDIETADPGQPDTESESTSTVNSDPLVQEQPSSGDAAFIPSGEATSDATTQNDGPPDTSGDTSTNVVTPEEGVATVVGDATPPKPQEIQLLIPQKRFRREGDADVIRISFDDIDLLKVLNMEPVPHDAVDYFPDWLKELDGKRIRIRGFMFPHFLATGIKRFALARDNGICCFVKEPKIYDVFEVALAKDEVTDYIEGKPFDVEGIFRIDPEVDDNELFQLYRIEDAKVLR